MESELSGKCREVSTTATGGQGIYTLPKTNIAPENRTSQKEVVKRKVFIEPIFRGYVDFREGYVCIYHIYIYIYIHIGCGDRDTEATMKENELFPLSNCFS